MTDTIPRLFADITAKLEDMHAIAVDGQRRDNTCDMQWVLACQLRIASEVVDTFLAKIKQELGDGHE